MLASITLVPRIEVFPGSHWQVCCSSKCPNSTFRMGKEKASAALFDQLQAAIEGGEGEEIVGKLKVRST